MAKASVVRHRFRRAICRGRKASCLLCVCCQRVKRFDFWCFSRPRESGNILDSDHKSSGATRKTTTNPDIGGRGLLIAGLRSAMDGKGKHRGPCVLHVTLIAARGRVHSLAMRCLRCCLAFPCGGCDSAMRVRSCSACTPT